jgi:hypothetical protein
MDDFKPDARQRAVIDAALTASKEAMKQGHFAPVELVRRMQLEADLSSSADDMPRGDDSGTGAHRNDEPADSMQVLPTASTELPTRITGETHGSSDFRTSDR